MASSHPGLRSTAAKGNMDEMNSDLALEVLDTPDRFPSSSDRRLDSGRRTFTHRCRINTSGLQNRAGSSPPNDTDFLFGQAKLARLMSEPSSRTQSTGHEIKQNGIPCRASTETIDLNEDSKDARKNIGKVPSNEIESNDSHGGSRLLSAEPSRPTRLVSKSGTVISLKPPVNSCKVGLSGSLNGDHFGSNCGDKGKGIELCSDLQLRTEQAPSRLLQLDAPRGKMEQRRLVRNGCISPSNITKNNVARGKKITGAKADEVGNVVVGAIQNGISSHMIHISSPNSEGRFADIKNKQVMVDDNEVNSGPHAKATYRSSRVYSAPGKEVTVIADVDGEPVLSEDIGWRTTRNPPNKSHIIATGHRNYVNVVCDSPEINALQHASSLSSARATSESGSENTKEMLSKGKRKYSQFGECSSSTFDDSEISCLQSSNRPSDSITTGSCKSHRRGVILGPLIEVDELHSPEVVCRNPREQTSRVSDDFNPEAGQVESDEMLARQLQEQLYNEAPLFGGTEEIDATIAWSLQQEEDVQRSSIARQDQLHHRGASAIPSFARVRNSSVRPTNRVRRSMSARMIQLRRNVDRPTMDLERLNFLEAMEAALDNSSNTGISNRILQVQRDFNENDYEMLLTLDSNNHHVGASESQINSLPQSVIETDNIEEACAVCLEPPTIGDTIRHLPCLHKFHKECIDTWLRRKRSCPICKSGIT